MNQFFIGIMLVLGIGCWWLYSENETLKDNNVKLELAVAEQQATIVAIQENFERQAEALSNMTRMNAEIEKEKDQYLAIFRKHNLDKIALMKPGLTETRVNNATKAVFEELENDSKNISNRDSRNSDQ